MTAIHVVLRTGTEQAHRNQQPDRRGHFDVVVDGINITARVGEGQALTVLAELGTTLAELLSGRRTRSVVQLYSESDSWELGLEIDGRHALMTVFKAGQTPEVAVSERRVELVALRHALLEALSSAKYASAKAPVMAAVELAHHLLSSTAVSPLPARHQCEISVTPRSIRNFAFRSESRLRATPSSTPLPSASLERSDLHALLFCGTFGVTARSRVQTIADVPVFLVAERLVELAGECLVARQQARPLFRRLQVGHLRLGVRLAPADAPMAFSLGSSEVPTSSSVTFPELDPVVFTQAVVLFVRSLRDALMAADPSQAHNLRLTQLTTSANTLAEQIQPADSESSLTNPRPEEYRRFAISRLDPEVKGRWASGVPMRFSSRWTATVPNIDLKSILVNGDHFLIGALRETACLNRHSGDVLWRKAMPRAGTLAIPNGFVRLNADGRLAVHDLESGDTRFSLRLVPRALGGAAGALVLAPGLPKIITVAEGDRRITAVDLMSGEIRWRYTARRPAPLRVRRAGRLVLVGGGDSVLVALDVISGETIWRATDRIPFTGDIAVEAEDAFLVAAGAQGHGHLHLYDVCSGELRWSATIEERPTIGFNPLVTTRVVIVAVRDARGAGARAYDRQTGAELWSVEPGQLPRESAWLTIDDLIVVNGMDGTVSAIEANTGAFRYRHVLSRPMSPDLPRQMQPVLRSGALFVPQQQVLVFRPTDGQKLGEIPTDLIPDVVRVDEQSAVYVAEESGHIACFATAPKLMRVK